MPAEEAISDTLKNPVKMSLERFHNANVFQGQVRPFKGTKFLVLRHWLVSLLGKLGVL